MSKKTKSVNIPKVYADAIDGLVDSGEFASRDEVVRSAVRDFLIARGMRMTFVNKCTEEAVTHG